MKNKFVGAIGVYSLVAKGGSGSFSLNNTNYVQIENFKLTNLKSTSSNVKMNNVTVLNGSIQIHASETIEISNILMNFTYDVMINSPKIVISESFFNYEKTYDQQSQLIVSQRFSDVKILNSTFLTNINKFKSAAFIVSNTPIHLTFNNYCCFNKDDQKSIKLAFGSTFKAQGDVFNCHIQPDTSDEAIIGRKTFDPIGFSIILISVIVLISLIIIYCFMSTKKAPDDSSPVALLNENLQVQFNETYVFSTVKLFSKEADELNGNDLIGTIHTNPEH